jgi:hypothetical protein
MIGLPLWSELMAGLAGSGGLTRAGTPRRKYPTFVTAVSGRPCGYLALGCGW